MSETPLELPPMETHVTAPPNLERVLAMRRDELRPDVRSYADNLHEQILAIFQEHGAKNFEDFKKIAEEQRLPISLLERVRSVADALLHVIETQELPYIFTVSRAVNPYHEALTTGGITDPTHNPERMDRVIDLKKVVEESLTFYQEHALTDWRASVASTDLSLLTPDKRAQIDTLVKDGWDIIAIMPGKEAQLQNLKAALTTLKPLWIKNATIQPTNGTDILMHLESLIDQKAAALIKDVPDRPYLLLTPPTKKPPDWTMDKTFADQKIALAEYQQKNPDICAMNPAEYVTTQVWYTRRIDRTAQKARLRLSTLDPLDKDRGFRFIDLPPISDGDVVGVSWFSNGRCLSFSRFNPGQAPEGGFRLAVRVEL